MSTAYPLTLQQRVMQKGGVVRDLLALTKPGIVVMTLLTAGWGLGLAPRPPSWPTILACLLGTALSVGSANAFNMWIERDVDRFMTRTRTRPLPDGRMKPIVALVFATVLGIASIFVLALWVNALTAVLSTLAIAIYALAYTPMKRWSPAALPVGAVSGAVPPLLGWTAATSSLSAPGLLLFGVLFTWQLPHFLAISIFRKDEYDRAGIRIVPTVYGHRAAVRLIVASSVAMLLVSAAVALTDAVGLPYLIAATTIGGAGIAFALRGLRSNAGERWARRYFFATLGYLPLLAAGMFVDVMLG
ncbi:MAG: heme o synthase [Myxococcota bacterium]